MWLPNMAIQNSMRRPSGHGGSLAKRAGQPLPSRRARISLYWAIGSVASAGRRRVVPKCTSCDGSLQTDDLSILRGFPASSRTLPDLRCRARKEGQMNDLRDAMSKCLASAKKQLDETAVSGVSLVLTGADNVVRYGSVAEDDVDLTSQVLLCAWATLRAINPDATAEGFAQAAFAVATQAETPSQAPALVELLSDPTASR